MNIKISLIAILLNTCFLADLFAQIVPLVYDVENTGANCTKPPLPSLNELSSIDALPDPFKWSNGSGRITNINDW
jgi:hypothetical protein